MKTKLFAVALAALLALGTVYAGSSDETKASATTCQCCDCSQCCDESCSNCSNNCCE